MSLEEDEGRCEVTFFAQAVTDYFASAEDELDLQEAELFKVLETSDSGWWYVRSNDGLDLEGWVPGNYLIELDDIDSAFDLNSLDEVPDDEVQDGDCILDDFDSVSHSHSPKTKTKSEIDSKSKCTKTSKVKCEETVLEVEDCETTVCSSTKTTTHVVREDLSATTDGRLVTAIHKDSVTKSKSESSSKKSKSKRTSTTKEVSTEECPEASSSPPEPSTMSSRMPARDWRRGTGEQSEDDADVGFSAPPKHFYTKMRESIAQSSASDPLNVSDRPVKQWSIDMTLKYLESARAKPELMVDARVTEVLRYLTQLCTKGNPSIGITNGCEKILRKGGLQLVYSLLEAGGGKANVQLTCCAVAVVMSSHAASDRNSQLCLVPIRETMIQALTRLDPLSCFDDSANSRLSKSVRHSICLRHKSSVSAAMAATATGGMPLFARASSSPRMTPTPMTPKRELTPTTSTGSGSILTPTHVMCDMVFTLPRASSMSTASASTMSSPSTSARSLKAAKKRKKKLKKRSLVQTPTGAAASDPLLEGDEFEGDEEICSTSKSKAKRKSAKTKSSKSKAKSKAASSKKTKAAAATHSSSHLSASKCSSKAKAKGSIRPKMEGSATSNGASKKKRKSARLEQSHSQSSVLKAKRKSARLEQIGLPKKKRKSARLQQPAKSEMVSKRKKRKSAKVCSSAEMLKPKKSKATTVAKGKTKSDGTLLTVAHCREEEEGGYVCDYGLADDGDYYGGGTEKAKRKRKSKRKSGRISTEVSSASDAVVFAADGGDDGRHYGEGVFEDALYFVGGNDWYAPTSSVSSARFQSQRPKLPPPPPKLLPPMGEAKRSSGSKRTTMTSTTAASTTTTKTAASTSTSTEVRMGASDSVGVGERRGLAVAKLKAATVPSSGGALPLAPSKTALRSPVPLACASPSAFYTAVTSEVMFSGAPPQVITPKSRGLQPPKISVATATGDEDAAVRRRGAVDGSGMPVGLGSVGRASVGRSGVGTVVNSTSDETYSYAQLMADRSLGNGKTREKHLSDDEFVHVFGVDKCKFYSLKAWKQKQLKLKADLF